MLIHQRLSCTYTEDRGVINFSSAGLDALLGSNFLFAGARERRAGGHGNGGLSFSTASGEHSARPPRDSEYVYRSVHPPLDSPLPTHGSLGVSLLAENGRRDKPRHKGKLSSTTRHGNRVAGRGVAAREEERNGRFIFQKGAQAKIYVYSHLLTRPRFFFRALLIHMAIGERTPTFRF